MYQHKMDIRMFDTMIPWEKDIYIGLMIKTIADENLKLELEKAARRAQGKKPPRRAKKK